MISADVKSNIKQEIKAKFYKKYLQNFKCNLKRERIPSILIFFVKKKGAGERGCLINKIC